MEWNGFGSLDSRPLCLPVEQPWFPKAAPWSGGISQPLNTRTRRPLMVFSSDETSPSAGSSARPALGAMQELIPDLSLVYSKLENNHILWQARKSDQLVKGNIERLRMTPLSVLHVPTMLSCCSHGGSITRGTRDHFPPLTMPLSPLGCYNSNGANNNFPQSHYIPLL